MLSIQIDTKSLELVIYHQFSNIKLSFFASHMKSSFPLSTFNRSCTVIRYFRVVSYCKVLPFVPSFLFVDLWAYKNAARIFYYHNICFYVTMTTKKKNNIISLQPKTITDFFSFRCMTFSINQTWTSFLEGKKKKKSFLHPLLFKSPFPHTTRAHSVLHSWVYHTSEHHYLSKVASSTAKYMKGERRKTFHAALYDV